jgi:hypothetical protein
MNRIQALCLTAPQRRESTPRFAEKTWRKITSHSQRCQADVEESLCKTLHGNDLVYGGVAILSLVQIVLGAKARLPP